MATYSEFPLLKLPLIAVEACVNFMSPDSIVGLAFHSQLFKSRLSVVKWKIEGFEWKVGFSQIRLSIHSNFGPCSFEIRRQSEFEEIMKKGIQVGTINLNGTTVYLVKCTTLFEPKWILVPEKLKDSNENSKFPSQLDTLENLTKFLMSFMRCSDFKLDYSLEKKLLTEDFFVWKYVKGKLNDLKVAIGMKPLELTPGDINFLIGNLKFGQLALNIRASDPNFKHHGYLEAEEMVIDGDYSWIDWRMLKCPKIVFLNSCGNISIQPIEHILKCWIQGTGMKNLEDLKLSNPRDFDLDEFLRKLKHENSKFSRKDMSTWIGYNWQDTVVRDIQRESDGRWGTLIIRSSSRIFFIVWTPEKLKECGQETRIKFGLD